MHKTFALFGWRVVYGVIGVYMIFANINPAYNNSSVVDVDLVTNLPGGSKGSSNPDKKVVDKDLWPHVSKIVKNIHVTHSQ